QTHFLEGLRDGVFLFVISIWIFMIIDSELRYGVINTVVSLLAFISYFVVLRIIRSSRRPFFILVGSILMYVAVIFILLPELFTDRKSTRLNSSHVSISYAVFCLETK